LSSIHALALSINIEGKSRARIQLGIRSRQRFLARFLSNAVAISARIGAAMKRGAYRGYVEPVFDHMSIFNPTKAGNPLTALWEGILEGVTRIVRNYSKDRFATKVPFAGTFNQPHPDIFATVFNAFRNALVKEFTGEIPDKNLKLPPVNPEEKQ
jgi:hypothetical protein